MKNFLFIYRNLEKGQTLYSQTTKLTQRLIYDQFSRPNWSNKRPSLRKDLWKIMCLVKTPNSEINDQVYNNLIWLKDYRNKLIKSTKLQDKELKNEILSHRYRNEWGRLWYSGQYRPIYCMETIADLIESLVKVSNTHEDVSMVKKDKFKIYWEDYWRMGNKSNWTELEQNVEHYVLPKANNALRDETNVVKEIMQFEEDDGNKLSL